MVRKKFKISVIIVSHNNKNIIPSNLNSLREQTYKNFDIYLMDNDSDDGTSEFIKKNYPEVNFYDISAGVDKKRNIGISKTNSEYIVTLDSDAILTKDWIKKAIEYMDKHKFVGICCGKMLNKDGLIDYAGSVVAKNGGGGDIGHGDKDKPKYNTFKRMSGMTTAASIIRRKIIEDIGGFDENYYYGYEDQDFGIRANFAGWKVVYNPNLIATHLYHSTVWRKEKEKYVAKNVKMPFYISRNRVITFLKNFELRTILINFPNLMAFLLYDSIKSGMPSLKAYFWVLLNFGKIIKWRKEAFKGRRVSDKEFFDIIYFPNTVRGYEKQNPFFSLLRRVKNKNKKEDVTFFITSRCNSKCKHCFYWKSLNKTKDLSLKEIEKILSNFYDLNSISLGGGEPFLRKDLDKIIKLVIKYTDVKTIDIPTNCLIDITDRFEQILKENFGVNFAIDCSLDGLKNDHDYIRGVRGSFDKTIKLIYKLSNLRKKYPNFKNLSVNTVLMNRNYENMPEFIKFVRNLPVDNHTLDIIRGDYHQTVGPPTINQIKKFNKRRYKIRKYYNGKRPFLKRIFNNLKDKEFIRIQERVFKNKKWPFHCTAGITDFVIESDGTAKICELHQKIGSLLKNTPEELMKTETAKKICNIIKKHECDCTHICNLYWSMDHSFKNLVLRPLNFLR